MEVVLALDNTLDLIESDVIVYYIGMEDDFEVDIFMWTDEPFSRVDTEELFTERQVPTELYTNVS